MGDCAKRYSFGEQVPARAHDPVKWSFFPHHVSRLFHVPSRGKFFCLHAPKKQKKNFIPSPRSRLSIKNVYRNQLVGLFSDVNIPSLFHYTKVFPLLCGMRKQIGKSSLPSLSSRTHSRRLFFSLNGDVMPAKIHSCCYCKM